MKLKLGKLSDTRNIRLAVLITADLKVKLDHYAKLHSQTWGREVDAETLVPHILELFISKERAFRNGERGNCSKGRNA